jgi:hypothetical protein
MSSPLELVLKDIQYHPDTGNVAMLLVPDIGGGFYANSTEPELAALAPPGMPEGYWANAECLLAAQAFVDAVKPGKGYVVVFPPTPAPQDPPAEG